MSKQAGLETEAMATNFLQGREKRVLSRISGQFGKPPGGPFGEPLHH